MGSFARALLGFAALAWGLIIDEDEALKLGLAPYASESYDEPDDHAARKKNLQLPPVRDRLRQSRNAKVGLALHALGIVVQIVSMTKR